MQNKYMMKLCKKFQAKVAIKISKLVAALIAAYENPQEFIFHRSCVCVLSNEYTCDLIKTYEIVRIPFRIIIRLKMREGFWCCNQLPSCCHLSHLKCLLAWQVNWTELFSLPELQREFFWHFRFDWTISWATAKSQVGKGSTLTFSQNICWEYQEKKQQHMILEEDRYRKHFFIMN